MSASTRPPRRRRVLVPVVLALVASVVLGGLGFLLRRARAEVNLQPLSDEPKGVSVVAARAESFRPTKRFVGTLDPWVEARIGPQLVSAYVETVLVRPGARVRKGEVVATLDCRSVSNASRTVALQSRALEERQRASEKEAARFSSLGDGFVAKNEVDRKLAEARIDGAQLSAIRSQLASRSLEVDDCTLRSPFDGEVAIRHADPGTFARPGVPILAVVDRTTVRAVIQVSEIDFRYVLVGTPVQLKFLADGRTISAPVSRLAPQADLATRTLRVEIDLDGKDLGVPIGTSVEVEVAVGEERPATVVPLTGARVRGDKATLFVVEGEIAKPVSVSVLGERGSQLFLDRSLPAGSRVVVEGRQTLKDGDRVVAKTLEAPSPKASAKP